MAQIDIELAKLKETKASIAQSITAKGGVLDNPSEFSTYSMAIDNLPGTVADTAIDFSVIGYSSVPEILNVRMEYAKLIMSTWDNPTKKLYSEDLNLYFFPGVDTSNLTSMVSMFYGSNIMCIPEINVSNVTNYDYCFYYCKGLDIADLSSWDTSKAETMVGMFALNSIRLIILPENFGCADMNNIFSDCYNLVDINWENLDLSKAINLSRAFAGCTELTIIPELDTSNCINMEDMFDSDWKIFRIEGLDVRSVTSGFNLFGGSADIGISYMVLKNLGTRPSLTTFNFRSCSKWGINTEQNPDARQSLIDTLITYSVDRTGMGVASILLSTNTKALLTEDEIAQITAKGYTLS